MYKHASNRICLLNTLPVLVHNALLEPTPRLFVSHRDAVPSVLSAHSARAASLSPAPRSGSRLLAGDRGEAEGQREIDV